MAKIPKYFYFRVHVKKTSIELEDASDADVVEVVRCKDCKHSTEWYGDRRRCFLWCEDGISVFEDGFCNYWDRKDD